MSHISPQAKYTEEITTKTGLRSEVIAGYKPQPITFSETPLYRFGGIDLAKRVDHSAIVILRLEKDKDRGFYLWQEAFMEWPHVNYKTVAAQTLEIHKRYPMEKIGFDRSGVGDAASELFDKSTLPLEEVVTTMQRKMDIIKIIKGLFENDKLEVDKQTKLEEQILIQETIITEAGNEKYQHPTGTHDDVFWALGYACFVALPYVTGYVEPIISSGPPPEQDADTIVNHLIGGADSIFSI